MILGSEEKLTVPFYIQSGYRYVEYRYKPQSPLTIQQPSTFTVSYIEPNDEKFTSQQALEDDCINRSSSFISDVASPGLNESKNVIPVNENQFCHERYRRSKRPALIIYGNTQKKGRIDAQIEICIEKEF